MTVFLAKFFFMYQQNVPPITWLAWFISKEKHLHITSKVKEIACYDMYLSMHMNFSTFSMPEKVNCYQHFLIDYISIWYDLTLFCFIGHLKWIYFWVLAISSIQVALLCRKIKIKILQWNTQSINISILAIFNCTISLNILKLLFQCCHHPFAKYSHLPNFSPLLIKHF